MTTWVRMMLALVLAVGAFVVAPMADAATCAPEVPASHAVVDHDAERGDHSEGGGGHGICSHGHCHHNAAARQDGDADVNAPAFIRLHRALPVDDLRVSSGPDSPRRPPRA